MTVEHVDESQSPQTRSAGPRAEHGPIARMYTVLRPSVGGDHAHMHLGDVIVRRWTTADAEALALTVTANLDHLRPWMPWIAAEPMSIEGRRTLLEDWQAQWESGGDHQWGIFAGSAAVGSIGLMDRVGAGGLEIGYWIDRRFTGRGIVTRSAAVVTEVAFRILGVERVEIHHDRGNRASSGVPRRLGYRLVAERAEEPVAPAETGTTCIWRATDGDWTDGDRTGR